VKAAAPDELAADAIDHAEVEIATGAQQGVRLRAEEKGARFRLGVGPPGEIARHLRIGRVSVNGLEVLRLEVP